MDLISIIVPVYNVEQYLRDCIESIINQSYRNLQIILVDDGSLDDCPRICDEYACKDHRIEVIHKENGGLSDARNVGVDQACGKYISFVDSDDRIAEDMIESLYDRIVGVKADMSVCQRFLIGESGDIKDDDKALFEDYVVYGNKECVHDFMSSKGIDTVAWGKLYRTELFQDIRYPKGKYHEDVFITYRLVAKSNVIAVSGEKKYCHRIRNASITQSSFSSKHLDAVIGKCEIANFMEVNYPSELVYAQAGIVYAANQCVWRMGISHCFNKQYMNFLQSKYRSFETPFLRYGKNRFFSKIFSICAFISVNMVVKSISIIKN